MLQQGATLFEQGAMLFEQGATLLEQGAMLFEQGGFSNFWTKTKHIFNHQGIYKAGCTH